MYAVVRTGGKQYRVSADDVLAVEKLEGAPGDALTFQDVLMVGDGTSVSLASGASVAAEIVEQFKTDKVIVFKKKRRHNYRRKAGHRQNMTLIKIVGINASL